ncbi:MAG TPA: hypothetical protein VGF95_11400 [Solirubrobacteraceae bacterium]|jgi:hypothetical protein
MRAFALALAVLTIAAIGLALPTLAAATPSPLALDAPNNGEPPQVAFDPATSTTYVAWTDPQHPAVDLCVLPPGTSACEGGGPVLLEDSKYPGYSTTNRPELGGLAILPGGETVVIGTPVVEGSIAWASPAGGSAFLGGEHGLQYSGQFISPVSLFYTPGNVVPLSSTDVGLFDDYGDHFSDSPLSAASPTPPAEVNPGGQFTRPYSIVGAPTIAAEPAPAPAAAGEDIVVGVGTNEKSAQLTPPGCINDAATGFGVSVGKVEGTSNATGTLNAEGLPAYGLLSCSAKAPVLASGGGSGIVALEEEGTGVSGAGSDYTLDSLAFNATSKTFSGPVQLADVTGETLGGVDALDLSEDNHSGLYALWEDGDGAAKLDYSSNSGASWEGPVAVPSPASASYYLASGVGDGIAEIVYEANPGTGNQVFLQTVNYGELATPVPAADTISTTQQAKGGISSASGSQMTIVAGMLGEYDEAKLSGANAASATGTMTYGLYDSSSCSSGSEVFNGGTVAVSGGVASPSSQVTSFLAPGKYYWLASYSGDIHNLPMTSACGSETLVVEPAAGIGKSGTSEGKTVTVTVTCPSSEPCKVTVTITSSGVTVEASASRVKKHKKSKTVKLATGKFTIPAHKTKKLSLKLTKAGAKLLKSHHHLKALMLVASKTQSGIVKTEKTITISFVKSKHKHHKKK